MPSEAPHRSQVCEHRQITNQYRGIQLVNGETTSKNFDKRPMGFRLWNVDKKPDSDTALSNWKEWKSQASQIPEAASAPAFIRSPA